MQLAIYKEKASRIPQKKLHTLFDMIAGREAKRRWQAGVNLIFTGDKRIRELNREHRGKNKATDVLSFTIDPPENAGSVFGEVYISTETAARQARELGHSVADEYLRLACHGLMHLFGYDHQRDAEAAKMEAREEQYLRRLAGG